MLNDGIRVLDLRYAWNPDLESIGFYHSKALLSPTTQLQDVLFGLYTWLDLHRTETILVSMNYEPGTITGTISWSDDARLQEALYDILMGGLARRYWVRSNGSLGTLGEARGKLILIQRFDFTLLPEHMTERIGIHLDPGHWIVNGKNTALEYGAGKVAYIQDYYKIDPSSDSHPSSCITDKLHTVLAHLERAIDPALHPDQLYISFASASFRAEEPSLTPQVYALGDGKDTAGVNQRLLSWLHEHQGRRFGIVFVVAVAMAKRNIDRRKLLLPFNFTLGSESHVSELYRRFGTVSGGGRSFILNTPKPFLKVQASTARQMSLPIAVLAQIVKGLNTVRYAQIAGGAFFLYDWLITMGMEVELVWQSNWNIIKAVYLFQRYLPFYDIFYPSYSLSYMVGIIASETLCSLRIWAVWKKDPRFYVVYPMIVVFIWVPSTVAMIYAIQNAKYSDPPFPGFKGCLTINADKIHLEYVWAGLLAYDTVSLIFVLIPGIQLYRNGLMGHSRLANVVFRDGVIYYITLFVFSLLNIIFTVSLDAATRSALANMGRALHSTLASRVLLHMRETAHVDRDDDHIHHIPAHRKMRSDIHITRTIHRDDHDELVKCDGAEKFTPIITSKSSV
uniref:DUF6533 domain-containing protein n=1 Tax=Psilocybe cubensis TaxID=181762 RepID=A0A8H7XX45_PSICU